MYFDKFLFTKSEPLESRFLEEFDQIELLSKGAFGHVYGARKKMENKKYAVKCIKLGKNHEEMAEDSTREVKVRLYVSSYLLCCLDNVFLVCTIGECNVW